jgi:CRP-like cAMP-binding protein
LVAGRDALDGRRLAALELLAGCAAASLEVVAAALRLQRLEAGEVLMREGAPGDTFALLIEGEVQVTRSVRGQERLLGQAGPGSILGELAVLRHRPRTATVTAVAPSLAAIGDADLLFELLDHPEVLERLRHLASARLAHDLRPIAFSLPDGSGRLLRPLLPEDRGRFGEAVGEMSADSLRRRFFSAGPPSPAMVEYLVDIDYVDHFAWLVLDGDPPHGGVATARYVRTGDDRNRAEVAFGVADRFQGRGIGTFLLGAVAVAAIEAGIHTLVGLVLEDNTAMRAVFAKAGGVSSFDEPGVIRVEIDPTRAAGLLDEGLRQELQTAVHDIVTAATLALKAPD